MRLKVFKKKNVQKVLHKHEYSLNIIFEADKNEAHDILGSVYSYTKQKHNAKTAILEKKNKVVEALS